MLRVSMTTRVMGPYIGGKSASIKTAIAIRNPYDASVVGEVGLGDERDLEAAISGAAGAFKAWSRSPTHQRALVLEKLALALEAEKAKMARLITLESGKPIRYSKAEVARALSTF